MKSNECRRCLLQLSDRAFFEIDEVRHDLPQLSVFVAFCLI